MEHKSNSPLFQKTLTWPFPLFTQDLQMPTISETALTTLYKSVSQAHDSLSSLTLLWLSEYLAASDRWHSSLFLLLILNFCVLRLEYDHLLGRISKEQLQLQEWSLAKSGHSINNCWISDKYHQVNEIKSYNLGWKMLNIFFDVLD